MPLGVAALCDIRFQIWIAQSDDFRTLRRLHFSNRFAEIMGESLHNCVLPDEYPNP